MDAICLQEMDTLYILGDAVDRGTGSCEILLDMMENFHSIPIIGNHGYMA